MPNKWELEEAQKALLSKEYSLCFRYLEKALEKVRCVYCHGELNNDKSYQNHYKGFVHDECVENYNGRLDYLRRNKT